jgi:hypothetical protein
MEPGRDRDALFRALWEADVSGREIGRRFRLSPSRVSTIARQLGYPSKARPITDEERARFASLYSQGLTLAEIARRAGRYRATVRNALVAAGFEIRTTPSRKWPARHRAFTPPCSPEAWYWIGVLAADGYVRGTSITLNQKAANEPLLRRFLAFVGSPDRPLHPGGRHGAKGATVCSRQMVDDLAAHGVVPKKSYSLHTSDEAAAEPAFWLGAFDGDGCIRIDRHGSPIIELVGTKSFMGQFARFLEVQVLNRRPAVGRCGSNQSVLWEVRVSGDSARQLAEVWLDIGIPSLEAKWARLEVAASYESRQTRARLADRWRRCELCGAWVQRMPSQFGSHVFCCSDHFHSWRWNRPVRDRAPRSEPGLESR